MKAILMCHSLIVRDKVTRQCPQITTFFFEEGRSHKTVSTNHNLSEEKGEPKRNRTEVLPLTTLTPYRLAKPAHTRPAHLTLLGGLFARPDSIGHPSVNLGLTLRLASLALRSVGQSLADAGSNSSPGP